MLAVGQGRKGHRVCPTGNYRLAYWRLLRIHKDGNRSADCGCADQYRCRDVVQPSPTVPVSEAGSRTTVGAFTHTKVVWATLFVLSNSLIAFA